MLSAIVDAMLESQAELEDATLDQWEQILFESCRKQKQRQAARHITLMAA